MVKRQSSIRIMSSSLTSDGDSLRMPFSPPSPRPGVEQAFSRLAGEIPPPVNVLGGGMVEDPLLLGNLKRDFDSLHLDRSKVLLCLLALDIEGQGGERNWKQIEQVLKGLEKSVGAMTLDLRAAYDREWGDGSFEEMEESMTLSASLEGANENENGQDGKEFPKRRGGWIPGAWPKKEEHAAEAEETKKEQDNKREFFTEVGDMNLSLRTITAKLQLSLKDLQSLQSLPAPFPQPNDEQENFELTLERDRLLESFTTIHKDLSKLQGHWERSRSLLIEQLFPPPPAPPQTLEPEEEEAEGSIVEHDAETKEEEEVSPSEARTSSIFSSELLTPDRPTTPTNLDEDVSELLLQGTNPAFLPPPGMEQVFEAFSGSFSTKAGGKGMMSREERIQRAREEREGKEKEKEGRERKMDPAAMVVELKDVIDVMKRRRERVTTTPSPATNQTPS
ncbi:hypothetical protein BT69DRAFT_377443 [Atractiella rhizophila]|nr:hypothetical protein BT69DRAFT_377443 [Atractiella rhizophila]